MAKQHLVCSGKGGVGKSTVTVCLARALCARGCRVLLVDCDVGLRALDLLTGLGADAVYNWQDVLDKVCAPSDALLRDADSRLALLMPPSRLETPFCAERFAAMLDSAAKDFDFCFLDAGAGTEGIVPQLFSAVDNVLLVATPDPVCARAAGVMADRLSEFFSAEHLRLLLNRFDAQSVRYGEAFSADRMIDETGVRLLGAVPEDANLRRLSAGAAPAPATSAAFDRIARRLQGEEVPFQEKKVKSARF